MISLKKVLNMSEIEKEKTPLAKLMSTNFAGLKFSSTVLKQAGKKLLKYGELKTIEFMTGKEISGNFKPPVKCNIVATSKSLEELPIYKASIVIQEFIYKLNNDDFNKFFIKPISSKEQQIDFFNRSNIKIEYHDVAGLNKIFNNAINTRNGVVKKVENRNKKLKEKAEKINLSFEEIKAFTDDGYLINKPGINKIIYCFQSISPKIVKNIENLPNKYKNYDCGVNRNIIQERINRLDIKEFQPGHVPCWQRNLPEFNNTNNSRRRRKWYSSGRKIGKNYTNEQINQAKINDILLAKIKIGDDWILLDVRGLLRDLNRRKLLNNFKNKLSITDILGFFTGDPIIDVKRNQVTFSYKEGVVQVTSQKPIGNKKSKQLLEKLTENETITLVSVDLGQTHPVSVRISKLNKFNKLIKANHIDSIFLDNNILKEVEKYRKDYDELEASLYNEGLGLLDEKDRVDINSFNNFNLIENCKNNICNKFNLNIDILPWNKMSNNTNYIAQNFIDNGGDKTDVLNIYKDKSGKIVSKLMTDKKLCFDYKDKLDKNLREKLNTSIWNIKISSLEYKIFSQRKKELARRGVNWIEKEAKRLTGNDKVIFNIENLNIDNRIFSGGGKREIGWDNFFVKKKENRWFIQAFHNAFTDLGIHRGSYIIESNAKYTSQTCPDCEFCDKENRNGVNFICIKCGVELHADLQVATINLEKVAMTGISMPGPDCERFGGAKKTVIARKTTKVLKILDKNGLESREEAVAKRS